MKSLEVQLSEALGTLAAQEVEIASLKDALHKQHIETARVERAWKLRDSGLPEQSVKRINDAFGKSTGNAGLKQAIRCAKELRNKLAA